MEDIRKEQLNILLNGIKKVVSSKNCPEWIARDLTVAVKNAFMESYKTLINMQI